MFLVNGQVSEHLSLQDRAIHYGDGVFETIAVDNGAPLCWEKHLQRLAKGCHTLGIPAPSQPVLEKEAAQLLSNQTRAVLKIIISRGRGGRGYQSPEEISPVRILGLYDWPDYPPEYSKAGIEAGLCETRLGHQPLLAGIKHLNRLEQVLARSEAGAEDYPEMLMQDISGLVIEGTMSNVFIISAGRLLTPNLGCCGIAGVVRGLILEQAPELGLTAEIKKITLDEVKNADELFFCNSIMGIWPVKQLLEKSYPVGNLTGMIQNRLMEKRQIVA